MKQDPTLDKLIGQAVTVIGGGALVPGILGGYSDYGFYLKGDRAQGLNKEISFFPWGGPFFITTGQITKVDAKTGAPLVSG